MPFKYVAEKNSNVPFQANANKLDLKILQKSGTFAQANEIQSIAIIPAL